MDKKALMEQIEKNVKSCQKCRLYKNARRGVPGEGNIDSELAFIGEAPGAVEDDTGRPFVGRAGKLLESLLKEVGYKREEVWIGNIIKHRPPDNRDPLPDEIHACEPYLAMQLKIIEPEVIVTLGRFALNYFYPDGKITRDHGRSVKTDKYLIYPLYHPAAALRNGEMGAVLRKDFLKIPELLADIKKGVEISAEKEESDSGDSKDQTSLGF